MEYIEITTQALEKDINSMTERLKNVIEQMKVIVEDMKELNCMWTGAASSAYSLQFMQDCERMNEVQEMILSKDRAFTFTIDKKMVDEIWFRILFVRFVYRRRS